MTPETKPAWEPLPRDPLAVEKLTLSYYHCQLRFFVSDGSATDYETNERLFSTEEVFESIRILTAYYSELAATIKYM